MCTRFDLLCFFFFYFYFFRQKRQANEFFLYYFSLDCFVSFLSFLLVCARTVETEKSHRWTLKMMTMVDTFVASFVHEYGISYLMWIEKKKNERKKEKILSASYYSTASFSHRAEFSSLFLFVLFLYFIFYSGEKFFIHSKGWYSIRLCNKLNTNDVD